MYRHCISLLQSKVRCSHAHDCSACYSWSTRTCCSDAWLQLDKLINHVLQPVALCLPAHTNQTICSLEMHVLLLWKATMLPIPLLSCKEVSDADSEAAALLLCNMPWASWSKAATSKTATRWCTTEYMLGHLVPIQETSNSVHLDTPCC